jgi:signal transduction histidine kinase
VKELSEETEKLRKENAKLRQQLEKSAESIAALKTENIDALVIANETALRVYTEKSADKPYRILIEKMHEGAVTINEDGTIIYCNSYFANLVKLPLQKVIGTTFGNYIDGPSKNDFAVWIKNSSKQVVKEEVHIHSSEDKKTPVLLTINTLSLDNLSILSIILTDLTIQHENQEKLKLRTRQLEAINLELENSNKALAFQIGEKEKRTAELVKSNKNLEQSLQLNADKDRFLAILAHDLRSPFNSFLGLSDLLLENIHLYDISEIEVMINMINKSAQNSLALLEDLLKWARTAAGKIPFTPEKLNLPEICENFVEELKPNADLKNITINSFITEEIFIFADVDMVKSVFRNIISNAIKFSENNGRIEIHGVKNSKTVTISISDNGIGIAPVQLTKMFEISYVQTTKGTAGETGTGLGLLLCKEFVGKNGGKIWVESEPGKGSKFNFTLPLFTGQNVA